MMNNELLSNTPNSNKTIEWVRYYATQSVNALTAVGGIAVTGITLDAVRAKSHIIEGMTLAGNTYTTVVDRATDGLANNQLIGAGIGAVIGALSLGRMVLTKQPNKQS